MSVMFVRRPLIPSVRWKRLAETLNVSLKMQSNVDCGALEAGKVSKDTTFFGYLACFCSLSKYPAVRIGSMARNAR